MIQASVLWSEFGVENSSAATTLTLRARVTSAATAAVAVSACLKFGAASTVCIVNCAVVTQSSLYALSDCGCFCAMSHTLTSESIAGLNFDLIAASAVVAIYWAAGAPTAVVCIRASVDIRITRGAVRADIPVALVV